METVENSKGSAAIFGSNVFNESVMKERLPKNIFKELQKTIKENQPLENTALADVVANAMKDWAIEKGATHYCHWFQPMTGLTAEKHDAFIAPTADGKTILEFSGKALVQGEPDASSFPSGGLRATFEARGYTAWDCTSPAFIKQDGDNITLYIPCAFCSYSGQALDKKTPLLRSMDALDKQAVRLLRLLGNTTTKRVISTLGPEQEYFLIDRTFYESRMDLVLTGRTLFGAPSPRGQEMDDHYFGALHERVASFMSELNEELWKLGVSAKTQHNEVSPAQYEIAPIFATVNIATDHNQLTMETLRKVAIRHDFVCLLHEKPFSGVNGSGKHNNWSMGTDDGINLLDPGSTPHENMVFMVFLCAVVKAVDTYAKLLRASVANAGNEHRLGANEAPPAIVSIFLGDQLNEIFDQIAAGGASSSRQGGQLKLGVNSLPPLPRDCTDRNRTSPFAFTGNRFEFRMVGSSQSTSGPCFVINTIVAEAIREIADQLEKASDVKSAVQSILQEIAKKHSKVVFNGDNYSQDWVDEAARRGLPNIPSAVESIMTILDKENIDVLARHGVTTEEELRARVEILLENYNKTINFEALTSLDMARRQILPASVEFAGTLAGSINSVKEAGGSVKAMSAKLEKVTGLIDALEDKIAALAVVRDKAEGQEDNLEAQAVTYNKEVLPAMNDLRQVADELETVVDAEIWPLPTYAQMLFIR